MLDGQLYCNTLSYLRKGFDEYEGTVSLPSQLHISACAEDLELLTPDLESLLLTPDLVSDLNVFCMFAMWSPKVDDKILFDPESQLGSLRDLARTFGKHTVVIKERPEFFRRVSRAMSSNKVLVYRRGIVEYVESNAGEVPTTLPELMKVAFRKQKKFANEKEYRLAFLTGREPSKPFILNIGDIHDIAFRMRTQDVYDSIRVNERPLSDF